MKDYGSGEISSTEGFTDNHHFIEKPFRIQHLIKKIDFVLAKISGSTDVTHIIGPFVFFPEKKIITFICATSSCNETLGYFLQTMKHMN